jgi:methionyl-tRNA synthetase
MAQGARAEGVEPRAFADKMSPLFQQMCDALNISYDRFIRTSQPDHYRASQAIWNAMEERGDLYLDRYEGWYSVRDEAYYEKEELTLAEGGSKLSPHGTPVEWTVEESWFFRLSKYQQPLLDHYAANPEFIRPESRRNEVVRFVEGGLKDLSISRTSFDWGVPVPDSGNHVMYVWLDALTNYITGLGYPDDTELWRRYWPADVHLIGKDVVRFHAVYWPAFLMSAGIALPKQVYGHGFLLSRGEKMSKSVGNVVDPMVLAERFGVDALRYFLLREVTFGQDGNYSPEAIVSRANAELANSFGNLAQRDNALEQILDAHLLTGRQEHRRAGRWTMPSLPGLRPHRAHFVQRQLTLVDQLESNVRGHHLRHRGWWHADVSVLLVQDRARRQIDEVGDFCRRIELGCGSGSGTRKK